MRGQLEGHSGWVTSLATSLENPNMLLSGSRDKSLIIWNLTRDDQSYGYPKRSLHGHSHIVSDCVCSISWLRYGDFRLTSARSSHQTVPTPSQHPGTRLSVSGNWQPEPQLAASSDTTMMCSPSPSPPTTDKSSQGPVTAQSSYGTHWETANLPSPTRDTRNGYRVFDSARTLRTQSLLALGGISLSRYAFDF